MFETLPRGFVPNEHLVGALLPEWLQAKIDADWQSANPEGHNGRVYAAHVSDDADDVFLWDTSFAVRAASRAGKELEIDISSLGMDFTTFRQEYSKLLDRLERLPEEMVLVELRGGVLAVKIQFKTVNITSFGVRRWRWFPKWVANRLPKWLVAGDHKKAGAFPFGGILNIPDLFAHAEREIKEESGLPAVNLQIIGVVRDKKSIHFVGIFDAPSKRECRRRFDRREDPDNEMQNLLFLSSTEEANGLIKKWSPLGEVVEAALSR